jgi:hypothetical protein
MDRQEKINWIKWWLQRYGERDEDTFSIDVEWLLSAESAVFEIRRLYIALQYNFGSDGGEYEPMCFFKTNNKMNAEYIQNRTDEELEEAIEKLKSINPTLTTVVNSTSLLTIRTA